ncbi:L-histidine N(alpha)-methyltransferase [Fibrella sp. HMF5335]|uniref:L-histidine N(Alpha)-methyltransferase n=1 Tax=Fibrella rubiginis TaxID=2817060 RepID=A0A939GD33_9BACT|nr:L-histidine N(alpha)-methyltransferase [Fibrella rubiginis]MBO0935563.1 L-histidine N(alpha)-methyltransferase [Fibrella rubiginis]
MAVHGNQAHSGLNGSQLHPVLDAPTAHETEAPDLADAVWRGLTQSPKQLSSRFFYDDEGSRLFSEIMHLPEYYLTRCEYEILDTYKTDLLTLFSADNRPFDLVELGAGDGLKTKLLLNHFWNEQANFTYTPVDISKAALDGLVADITQQWPTMAVNPQHDDYFNTLKRLGDRANTDGNNTRLVVLFLGSNIGNFSPTEAVDFYRQIARHLNPGDLVLTGFDLQKHPAIIHAAYNDSQGLTRAFNLNLLRRLNRELGADFDLAAFDHYETYNPENGEARSYLVSEKEQLVKLAALNLSVQFSPGEVIHTEVSRKFSRAGVEHLAQQSGFALTNWFTDGKAYFADVVYQK